MTDHVSPSDTLHAPTSDTRIDVFDSTSACPLSINQEGRLQLDEMPLARLVPFHLARCYVCDACNVEALERALNELVSRHESLRTGFHTSRTVAGTATAVPDSDRGRLARSRGQSRGDAFVRANARIVIDVRSHEAHDAEGGESEAVERLAIEASTPFDLARPPLMRAVLVRLSAHRRLLLIVVHHLVADEWSMQLLEHELRSVYESLVCDSWRTLPSLSMRYRDFAVRQRQRLIDGTLDASLAYWDDQWDRYGGTLLSVGDFTFARAARPRSLAAAVERVSVDGETYGKLQVLVRNRRVSVYTILLAGLARALHEVTRKPKFAIWGLSANRLRTETEAVVGWFANAQLLGMAFDRVESGGALLAQVRNVALNASRHQEVPPAFLWERSQHRKSATRRFLTDAFVSFDLRAEGRTGMRQSSALHTVRLPTRSVVQGIQVLALQASNGLTIVATYPRETFDGAGVHALLISMRDAVNALVQA